jgi:hypothetical protein
MQVEDLMRALTFALAAGAVCNLSIAAFAQQSPLKEGDYVCRNNGQITGSFRIEGASTYVDSDDRQHAYQYDPALNVLNFDDGRQYFIGREDLLILVEGGRIGKHGCIRQIR